MVACAIKNGGHVVEQDVGHAARFQVERPYWVLVEIIGNKTQPPRTAVTFPDQEPSVKKY